LIGPVVFLALPRHRGPCDRRSGTTLIFRHGLSVGQNLTHRSAAASTK
jgi:hypothetical protein